MHSPPSPVTRRPQSLSSDCQGHPQRNARNNRQLLSAPIFIFTPFYSSLYSFSSFHLLFYGPPWRLVEQKGKLSVTFKWSGRFKWGRTEGPVCKQQSWWWGTEVQVLTCMEACACEADPFNLLSRRRILSFNITNANIFHYIRSWASST
jgi:hypothetical protein